MLEKESKYVLKQSVYFMGLVLLASLIFILISFSYKGAAMPFVEAFFGTWHFGLLIFSVFMGISAFSNDIKNGGMEYLLTLPYSRIQLLRCKILPRLAAVTVQLALYGILSGAVGLKLAAMTTIPVLKASTLALFCFSLYIIGLTFSVYRGSMVLSALAAIAVFTLYFSVIHMVPVLAQIVGTGYYYKTVSLLNGLSGVPAYMHIVSIGLLAAFIAAFSFAFKTFNLKPSKDFVKRHLKVFVPITLIITAVSIGWALSSVDKPYKQYYLTSSNQLIENDAFNVKLYDQKTVTILDTLYLFTPTILEKDGNIYSDIYMQKQRGRMIMSMNLDSKKVNTLYRPESANRLGHWTHLYKDSLAFFEMTPSGQTLLVVCNRISKAIKKIEVPNLLNIKKKATPWLFGAGETGNRTFWLQYTGYSHKWTVFKIYSDGQIMDLGKTDIEPLYLNNFLVTGNKGTLTFSKITEDGIDKVKELKIPRGLELYTRFSSNLEQLPTTECYGIIRYTNNLDKYERVYRLDLETLELNDVIQLKDSTGYFKYIYPNKWYFVAFDAEKSNQDKNMIKRLLRVKNGNMELIKIFEPFEHRKLGNFIGLYANGAVIMKDGKTKAFTLPGFTPITFEKLD
jgi:hypothetical protein